jgi:hypothetical protein
MVAATARTRKSSSRAGPLPKTRGGAHTVRVKQSAESRRKYGPYAVRPPGTVFEAPRVDPDTLEVEPPASSNGPAALRGAALAEALARLERSKDASDPSPSRP